MMNIPFVDLSRQAKNFEEEIIDLTRKVLRSGIYINGPHVKEFEKTVADLFCCNHAISVGNGSDALTFVLRFLNLKPNDEVICPANSFIATAWAIVAAGAQPVFCDVGDDLLLDPEDFNRRITSKTRACVPVHLTGRVFEVDAIRKICEGNNIIVIEDAAQSFGAQDSHGRFTGTLGFGASFSLHPLKNLGIYGDGGLITTNDDALAEYINIVRNHGLINRNEAHIWGYNSRLDELQAAYALLKLKNLSMINSRHIEIANFYNEHLTPEVVRPNIRNNYHDIYHNFVVVVPPEIRDFLIKNCAENGLNLSIHYPIPLHMQKCYLGNHEKPLVLTNTERLAKSMISLPIYPELTSQELDFIISTFNSSFLALV